MTERFKGRLADVIRRPLITEKATRAIEQNQYTLTSNSCSTAALMSGLAAR